MNGASILTKLVMRVFKWFGINGILTLFFIGEIFVCFGFISQNSEDEEALYEYTAVESVEELKADDPRLTWQGIEGRDDMNYYLVGIRMDNYYSEDIYYNHLGAEDQNGEYVSCTTCKYYDRDMTQYSIFDYIPAGTSKVSYFIIEIDDHEVDSVESVRLFDYNATNGGKKKGTKKEITVAIPQ